MTEFDSGWKKLIPIGYDLYGRQLGKNVYEFIGLFKVNNNNKAEYRPKLKIIYLENYTVDQINTYKQEAQKYYIDYEINPGWDEAKAVYFCTAEFSDIFFSEAELGTQFLKQYMKNRKITAIPADFG